VQAKSQEACDLAKQAFDDAIAQPPSTPWVSKRNSSMLCC